MRTKFKNANEAYNYFHNEIIVNGVEFSNTKALFNVGFTMDKPLQNHIKLITKSFQNNKKSCYLEHLFLAGTRV